jgi:transposase
MTAQHYPVVLKQSEIQHLNNLIRRGVNNVRVVTRARILLMSNRTGEGKKDSEISTVLGTAWNTPLSVRKRYNQGGITKALYDAPRCGAPKKITGQDEAIVCAIACTKPPDGYSRWTMTLLKKHAKEKLAKSIGRSTVHRITFKNDIKPWREKNVVHSYLNTRIYKEND